MYLDLCVYIYIDYIHIKKDIPFVSLVTYPDFSQGPTLPCDPRRHRHGLRRLGEWNKKPLLMNVISYPLILFISHEQSMKIQLKSHESHS